MTYTLQSHYPLSSAWDGQPRPVRAAAGRTAVLIIFGLLLLAMTSQDGCPLEQQPPPPPEPDFPWPEPKGDQSGPWGQNAALVQAWKQEGQGASGSRCPHEGHPGHVEHADESQMEYLPGRSGSPAVIFLFGAIVIAIVLAGGGSKAPSAPPAVETRRSIAVRPGHAPPLHEFGKNPWEA
jgi:hypothetical protein